MSASPQNGTPEMPVQSPSVDPAEVAKFSRMAAEWWDPTGKFKPLHKINPVRLGYIRDHAFRHYNLDDRSRTPLDGLSLLDIGCGGGLLCEPLARLGAKVTGIDVSDTNIKIAALHAREQGVAIDYRSVAVEEMAKKRTRFDIVLNMEVVEHVADVEGFVGASAKLVKPGGLMFMATLNRTLKSFALAIVGAEYILGWLPKGTHKWEKFLTPQELSAHIEDAGLAVVDRAGVVYSPLADNWRLSGDLDVNYMLLAAKPDK
jgi:2-polyprenyl-6-hydroxyphenyl methylase/3-demethylubiquinone-9 3-methyltransferase